MGGCEPSRLRERLFLDLDVIELYTDVGKLDISGRQI